MRTFNNIKRFFNRYTFAGIIILAIVLYSCVDEYNPIVSSDTNFLSIDASLIKGVDTQKVVITKSVNINENEAYPPYVGGCIVNVEDEFGNIQSFTEVKTILKREEADDITIIEYKAVIGDDFLVLNRKYRINVQTSDGKVYQSDWETIFDCPPVDSIYTRKEEMYSYDAGLNLNALQFYIDLKASANDTKFYRWSIDETWEYIVPYSIGGFWDYDTLIFYDGLVTDSLKTCYNSGKVSGYFSSNTLNLTENEKKMIPLNYLFEGSPKVSSRYSILVSQYSLSEKAYSFWQQKQVELQESGGLYTSQPGQIISNFRNVNDASETVVGYFWASTRKQKRAFYNKSFGTGDVFTCPKDTFHIDQEYPNDLIYYYMNATFGDTVYITSYEGCFDCTNRGGHTTPPEFWQ